MRCLKVSPGKAVRGRKSQRDKSKEENPAGASLCHSAQTGLVLTPILQHPTLASLWLSALREAC